MVSMAYSIVKDSSADLGVNSKIVHSHGCQHQNFKKNCIYVNILIFLRENKEA